MPVGSGNDVVVLALVRRVRLAVNYTVQSQCFLAGALGRRKRPELRSIPEVKMGDVWRWAFCSEQMEKDGPSQGDTK